MSVFNAESLIRFCSGFFSLYFVISILLGFLKFYLKLPISQTSESLMVAHKSMHASFKITEWSTTLDFNKFVALF